MTEVILYPLLAVAAYFLGVKIGHTEAKLEHIVSSLRRLSGEEL